MKLYHLYRIPYQRFSTSVLQEFLKHAIPDYLVKGTDIFFLWLSNKKMTTTNTTIAVWCEWIKIIPIFLSDCQKYNMFLVCHRISVISLCVPWDEKVENHWSSLGWGGSVDWTLACEPKGRPFDSWVAGQVPSWEHGRGKSMDVALTHWCFPPSCSLPSPLSKK